MLINTADPTIVRDPADPAKPLRQRTPEWLEWRSQGITATDSYAIAGLSPFSTTRKWYERRVGNEPEEPQNPFMRRGAELEPIARRDFEVRYDRPMPALCVEHPTVPILRASLDGLDKASVLEIFAPSSQRIYEEAIAGNPPDYKYAQCQWTAAVAGRPVTLLWVWNEHRGGKLVEVERDNRYAEELLEMGVEAWQWLVKRTPPDVAWADTIVRDDDAWLRQAQRWCRVTGQIQALEERQQDARATLLSMVTHRKMRGGGVLVYKSQPSGKPVIDKDSMLAAYKGYFIANNLPDPVSEADHYKLAKNPEGTWTVKRATVKERELPKE